MIERFIYLVRKIMLVYFVLKRYQLNSDDKIRNRIDDEDSFNEVFKNSGTINGKNG